MKTASKTIDARVKFLAGVLAGTFGRIIEVDEARWTASVRTDDGKTATNVAMKHLEVLPEATITDKEKLLDRIRKLHAKAESAAKIGNEAEALAFAAGVQKMLATYRLEMSDLEMTTFMKDEPIGHSMTAASSSKRAGWSELLASVVARAHYCRILVHRNSDAITLVGRTTDRKVAEFIYTMLRRIADEQSDKEARQFRRNERKRAGSTEGNAKNFRAAWLQAFVVRVMERYAEEEHAMKVEASKAGTSLVRLSNALAEVDDFMKTGMRIGRAKAARTRQSANQAGREAGRAAGSGVKIRGTGLGASTSATKLIR